MLCGDPSTLAIWRDPIASWSDERVENGCFGYFVGSRLFLLFFFVHAWRRPGSVEYSQQHEEWCRRQTIVLCSSR